MSSVILNLPEEVCSRLVMIAEATAMPVEQVMVSRLRSTLDLPNNQPDEDDELLTLQQLSDDAL